VKPRARAGGLSLWVALFAAAVSCRPASEDADLAPPPGFAPPAVRPLRSNPAGPDRLGFGAGFYPPDVLDDRHTWHWMGASGELRLRSDASNRRLRLLIGVPLRFMSKNPTIRLTLDGRPLDQFVPITDAIRKEYAVPWSTLGGGPAAVLRFETNVVARVPGDSRDLGLSIQEVDWSADERP
jgi:hypothetical protein